MNFKEARLKAQGEKAPTRASQTIWGQLNRAVSIYFSVLIYRLPITPNQITAIGVCIYTAGMALYAAGRYELAVVGFVLLAAESLLDAMDGEVHRLKEMKTKSGGLFSEPVSHDIKYAFLLLPIAYGMTQNGADPFWYIIAGAGTTAKLLFRLLEQRWAAIPRPAAQGNAEHCKNENAQAPGANANSQAPGANAKFPEIYAIYRNLFTSTGILFPLLILTIINKLEYFVGFYSFAFIALFLLLLTKKIFALSKMIAREEI